jgi:hypothetical protein
VCVCVCGVCACVCTKLDASLSCVYHFCVCITYVYCMSVCVYNNVCINWVENNLHAKEVEGEEEQRNAKGCAF